MWGWPVPTRVDHPQKEKSDDPIQARQVGAAAAIAVAGLAVGATGANAEDPTTATVSQLTAAGIDVAQLAPGWTVVDDEIVWGNGDVIATIGPAAYDSCDSGYLCFFADKSYNGRMLQFRDTGLRSDMRDYSFNDQMSSWRSRRGLDARWYYDAGGSGTSRCIESLTANSDVGSGIWNTDNDEMTSFRIYSNDTSC